MAHRYVEKPQRRSLAPVCHAYTHDDMAVGSYRFAGSWLIPQKTKVALQTHKKDLMREMPNFAKRKAAEVPIETKKDGVRCQADRPGPVEVRGAGSDYRGQPRTVIFRAVTPL